MICRHKGGTKPLASARPQAYFRPKLVQCRQHAGCSLGSGLNSEFNNHRQHHVPLSFTHHNGNDPSLHPKTSSTCLLTYPAALDHLDMAPAITDVRHLVSPSYSLFDKVRIFRFGPVLGPGPSSCLVKLKDGKFAAEPLSGAFTG